MRTHIISTFHYDVIYLKEYRSYLEESIRILDRALELLEREADYKFTVEQILPVREYFRRHPERRMQMRRLAQSGRLCFAPGMLVMPDMNLGGGETLFRQIESGRSWLRDHLGVTPDACWIADCWGHHAQLPQMLSQSGYRSYFFWRGMDPEFRQNNFRWKGLDGTELLTHWLPRGYSGIFFPEKQPGIANAEEQRFAEGVRGGDRPSYRPGTPVRRFRTDSDLQRRRLPDAAGERPFRIAGDPRTGTLLPN